MLVSFSSPTTFYSSSVMKQWHITPYCKTYDWNNAKITATCECVCEVPCKHSETITYYKSCLRKQQFSGHPKSTTTGRRPVANNTHTPHGGGRSCGWHTAACTRWLSPASVYKRGNIVSLSYFSSMPVTLWSSAYQLMTLPQSNFIFILCHEKSSS